MPRYPRILALTLAVLAPALAWATATGEHAHNTAFCASVEGTTEVRHRYTHPSGRGTVIVDCETADTVYEGGLDKRSSLDSVQQALFFSAVTGKRPAVVIYDTMEWLGSLSIGSG